MTEQEIETKVIGIVAEQMGVDKDQITRETSFTKFEYPVSFAANIN